MLIVAAIAVVVFLGVAPSIIDRFPYEQRERLGIALIPVLFLLVGAVFLLAKFL